MKYFPSEDFSWIDGILLEKENEDEGEHAKDTPFEDEHDGDIPSEGERMTRLWLPLWRWLKL